MCSPRAGSAPQEAAARVDATADADCDGVAMDGWAEHESYEAVCGIELVENGHITADESGAAVRVVAKSTDTVDEVPAARPLHVGSAND